jgi:hypothetical protein
MSRRAQSYLLTQDRVLRRMQGATSYKLRIGLDINNKVKGNP